MKAALLHALVTIACFIAYGVMLGWRG